MKLLLTSAGFTNKTISNALLELVGKPFKDLKLVFIPTAANVESGGKEWLITDLYNCLKLNFKKIEIVDIAAVEKNIWLPQVEEADVIMVGGGNTFYLMEQLKESGLDKLFSRFLEHKIYVGISAGSMVMAGWNSTVIDTHLYDEKPETVDKYKSLELISFFIYPHLNSEVFLKVNLKEIGKIARQISKPVYALDDNSAIVVNGDKISVVSEGQWKKFN